MSGPEKPAAKSEASRARRAKRLVPRLFVGLLVLGMCAGGVWALWQRVRKDVYAAPRHVVQAEAVSATPPPAWIRTDIKAEVVRDIFLAGPVSDLDEDLGERFYEAFAAHPWVAKVVRVTKRSPAVVQVDLVYRRPVLMVRVHDGLLPVDGEGVQLLTADFSPLEAGRYPRLAEIGSVTPPPAGTRWADSRVVAAARLAAVLIDTWQELGLHQIGLAAESAHVQASTLDFDLLTKAGTRVHWGPAPGPGADEQAAAADKLSRLRHYAAEHGTLDGARGPQDLDLRDPHGVRAVPRTAAVPKTEG
ncbi:MAG TPA: hypothetical protein VHC22_34145 [Pirellulales bacterium]|nr:hypothetical protein [Pirellulales bacterium]